MKQDDKLVQVENGRQKSYKDTLQKIHDGGYCPFCEEHFLKNHPDPILFKTDYWTVTTNAWPYDYTKNHFLLVYRPEHVVNSLDIKPEAYGELVSILKILTEKYSLGQCTLLMRSGDMSKTGASVKHIHAQIIEGDPNHPEYDPKVGVITRVG